jgi:hypothetical protein
VVPIELLVGLGEPDYQRVHHFELSAASRATLKVR